jgi:hypothetical protein
MVSTEKKKKKRFARELKKKAKNILAIKDVLVLLV